MYAGGFQPIRKLKFFSQLGVDTAETKISACVLRPPLSPLHIRPPVHCSYLNTSLLRLGPSRSFHSSPVSSPLPLVAPGYLNAVENQRSSCGRTRRPSCDELQVPTSVPRGHHLLWVLFRNDHILLLMRVTCTSHPCCVDVTGLGVGVGGGA